MRLRLEKIKRLQKRIGTFAVVQKRLSRMSVMQLRIGKEIINILLTDIKHH